MIEVQRGDVGGRPPAPFISQEKMKSLLLQLWQQCTLAQLKCIFKCMGVGYVGV